MMQRPYRPGQVIILPVAAKKEIEKGAIIALTAAGYVVDATDTTAAKIVGRADCAVSNLAGAAGDVTVSVFRKQAFLFTNGSGEDELKPIHLMETCYLIDQDTVGATSDSDKRLEVGLVLEITNEGVWVEIA